MQDHNDVREAFAAPGEFWSSPLYQQLAVVVAGDPFLLGLASWARPGQVPTFAFFGAVHFLLLGGIEHPLGEFYPSVRGDDARPPAGAGAALIDFSRDHADAIRAILTSRLVQTNQVRRAVGLRLGLNALVDEIGGRPAHLLEIGCSAGLLLRHELYGYSLGDRRTGRPDSPVQLVTQWRGTGRPPDLDAVPELASTTGIDLNPLDPAAADDRAWLEALIWPEDREKARLLHAALALAADHPVRTLRGDGIDLCAGWSARLPAWEPRIVFHCATRMHVPADRVATFDAAIDDLDDDGPTFRIAVEGDGVVVTGPCGAPIRTYAVDGHLAWAAPVPIRTE